MSKMMFTKRGTRIVDDIEYNEWPSPYSLIKAMEKKWAIRLRDEGCLRFSSVEFYRQRKNPDIGDINEAKGMLKQNGHPYETGSVNEIFIWCSSVPEASPDVLKVLDSSYDTIVRIHDVEKFVKRIVSAAESGGYSFPLLNIGRVKYNRGEEVSKKELNNQQWQFNVFQKSSYYSRQMEYRLSFISPTNIRIGKQHIYLSLGDCSDIIEVET